MFDRWPHSIPLWQSTHLIYNSTLLPPTHILITVRFSLLFLIPGRWVEGPMSWPTRPTIVHYTVVPNPPTVYTFPIQSYTVMLYFSLYCRPEGDYTLISRNPLLPFGAHKSLRLCLRGMCQIVLLQNSGTVPSV